MEMAKSSFILLLVALTCPARASNWSIGAEVTYANVSGVQAFEASKNSNRNLSKELLVPSISISKAIGVKANASLRFTRFENLKAEGESSDTDVFGEADLGFPVVTHYGIKEKMDEVTFSYVYKILKISNFDIQFGPNLSYFNSDATFNITTFDLPDQIRSRSSYAFGAEANATIELSDKVRAELNYRFANPPDRDIHIVSLAVKFKL